VVDTRELLLRVAVRARDASAIFPERAGYARARITRARTAECRVRGPKYLVDFGFSSTPIYPLVYSQTRTFMPR
jgi:hypothetical protein